MFSSLEIDQLIYNTAIKSGFSDTAAKLVVAQARFESADYKSNVFKNNLNTSGMKYIGQPLATRGSLAPLNERSSTCRAGGVCKDSDHYAKFSSVEDSAKDKIDRLYEKTMGGVTPQELKNVQSAEEFARLLKKRSYYGFGAYGTPTAESEIKNYTSGLNAKLRLINVQKFIEENKVKIGASIIGVVLLFTAYIIAKKYYK
jgi:hypothetical protein